MISDVDIRDWQQSEPELNGSIPACGWLLAAAPFVVAAVANEYIWSLFHVRLGHWRTGHGRAKQATECARHRNHRPNSIMDYANQSPKERIRQWMQDRQRRPSPPPPLEKIRLELWHTLSSVCEERAEVVEQGSVPDSGQSATGALDVPFFNLTKSD